MLAFNSEDLKSLPRGTYSMHICKSPDLRDSPCSLPWLVVIDFYLVASTDEHHGPGAANQTAKHAEEEKKCEEKNNWNFMLQNLAID